MHLAIKTHFLFGILKKHSTRQRNHASLDDKKATIRNNEFPIRFVKDLERMYYTKLIEICYNNTTPRKPLTKSAEIKHSN